MTISQNIAELNQKIIQAELASSRPQNSVLLLAVSKQQNIEAIEQAYSLGITDFGENYYQEAEKKIKALQHLAIKWHFIGPIQSNKTKGIATHFTWVHSVNRLSIAEHLDKHRKDNLPPLNLCLQVNIVDEPTKAGVPINEVKELVRSVLKLPNLRLRGLMTIPPPQKDPQAQYELFALLQRQLKLLNTELGCEMDTLSMGMSDDLIPAIKAGATIVRVGRALFGDRIKKGVTL